MLSSVVVLSTQFGNLQILRCGGSIVYVVFARDEANDETNDEAKWPVSFITCEHIT